MKRPKKWEKYFKASCLNDTHIIYFYALYAYFICTIVLESRYWSLYEVYVL